MFVFLVEMGFLHVGQAGLKLSASGDPPASASQVLGLQALTTALGPEDFLKNRNLILIYAKINYQKIFYK